MPRDQVSPNNDLVLDVLDYWHKIEFFIPFDLKSRIESALNQDKPARRLDIGHGATSLANLRTTELPAEKEVGGYTLFVGVFDKGSVTSLCDQIVPTEGTEVIKTDDDERADLEGETCFAQISLSAEGEPSFESMSVSTLPWALGKAQKYGLNFLSMSNFEADWNNLERQIYNFQSKREESFRKRKEEDENLKFNSLEFPEIVELCKLLADWADFSPLKENDIAFVEMWIKEKRAKSSGSEPNDTAPAKDETDINDDEEDAEEETEQTTEIGILNSFFIKDIERAASDIRINSDEGTNLHKYISAEEGDGRTDLFTVKGQKEIINQLSPSRTVQGRWFDEPHHMMSLMQQFSINSAFTELQNNGIFSVNGPPGTGKTTLLREMFAENIVRRGEVLSTLKTARDAFESHATSIPVPECVRKKHRLSTKKYRPLKSELTGFEMVVVSANNAAVENISRELPQSGAIGEFWKQGKAPEYLKPIAYNVAAKIGDSKFRQLPEKEIPWGLFSCVLGRAKNRNTFKSNFLFSAKDVNPRHKPQTTAQGLWEWLRNYSGPSFTDARELFRSKKVTVDALREDLSKYENLINRYGRTSLEAFLSEAQEKCDSAERAFRLRVRDKEAAEQSLEPLEAKLQSLREQERLLDRESPAWWEKLFVTAAARRHKIDVRHNANEQRSTSNDVARINEELRSVHLPAVKKATDHLEHAKHALNQCTQEWEEAQAALARYRTKYPDVKVPASISDIEQDTFQISGLWHTQELAKARSELFQVSLVLHEAWLAEAAGTPDNKGPMRAHIHLIGAMLSSPSAVTRPNDASALWQSFFLMVPVVSTTFASFGNQFSALGRDTLGWVFIDEAGQAPPQASVGAFWRGKRVIAVGDPRQIEPVFTVPTTLIEALSEQSPNTEGGAFAPNRTSVQELSDKGNRFGAYVDNGMGDDIWIGSPLRVHRRCIDPMFSVANKIAYQNNMVFGLPSHEKKQDISIRQESCWIDIRGNVRGKQTVDTQVSFAAKLVKLLAADGQLPEDVFIITPFKEIRRNLIKSLNEEIRSEKRFKKSHFDKWCRTSVGTVHTFQGKEAAIVLFILGADQEHDGSAKWASSKPNLLNVALTRAKQRIFIVGDPNLWGKQKHFSTALMALPKVHEREFLERLHTREA
ncbi:hypothetical protein UF64_10065 [Thalassospira sp. HJ]|uniref:DEAD/DEAH box helicase n=1 Tax=Thalassospira sp. HJ TaxID=1616823 RepID=UPI0005CE9D19|nr:DEAD/DEAH box helicase [Thalassospira sp. HJ]KJE35037.1 hypothetical protein UF64_10065 [Thalassospira sp. HJ]